WKEFLESVRTSGIIEPIICNQNKVAISGNQRLRACKELNLDEVMCDIRIYDNEQQEIKDLIETNIRQRGDISSSSLK
ncbi:ParB N-terminal domain-containing protein, partial [Clostridium sp. ZBS5]|uniref:ParB N-terminal domain-containing protein n=1 Tax=Clostridium sp. ZBS5 TaxID=2949973 RepID=UPI0020799235